MPYLTMRGARCCSSHSCSRRSVVIMIPINMPCLATAWPRNPEAVGYITERGPSARDKTLCQAVAKHGMLIGIMMTTDRLLHEWDEQQRAPRIVRYGISRAYDPVEANDFWWAREAE